MTGPSPKAWAFPWLVAGRRATVEKNERYAYRISANPLVPPLSKCDRKSASVACPPVAHPPPRTITQYSRGLLQNNICYVVRHSSTATADLCAVMRRASRSLRGARLEATERTEKDDALLQIPPHSLLDCFFWDRIHSVNGDSATRKCAHIGVHHESFYELLPESCK